MLARRWRPAFSAVLLPGLILLGCASSPGTLHYATEGEGLTTGDGLHRVKYWNAGAAFVRPGASMAHYDKVISGDVTIKYARQPDMANESSNILSRDNYALSPSVVQSINRSFHEAIEQEFGKSSHFAVADRPGPDTIVVFGHLIDLNVTAPPFRYQESDATVYAGTLGSATLFLDVRDSVTGKPLVRVVTRSAITLDSAEGLHLSSSGSSTMAIRQLFNRRSRLLRLHLDEFRREGAIPVKTAAADRTN